MHFPDGHPTLANPYPTLLLGYATASSATKTRKPPRERLPTPLHSQTNKTQATEQSAPEQYAPVVEDDILLVNEQSHTAINYHWYSQTSSGCQTSRLMWMAMAKHMVPADQQTKLLIHLLKELDDEFLSRWRRNEDLWAKFIGKLHAAGFRGKTGLQVNTKWNDLKKKYRKAKVNNRSTDWACKNFPFEDEMDDFIGEKASTNR